MPKELPAARGRGEISGKPVRGPGDLLIAMRLGVNLRQAYFLDIDPTMSQLDFSCQHLY